MLVRPAQRVHVIRGRGAMLGHLNRIAGRLPLDSFFFSSRRRHTRLQGDWSSDVCSSDLPQPVPACVYCLRGDGVTAINGHEDGPCDLSAWPTTTFGHRAPIDRREASALTDRKSVV